MSSFYESSVSLLYLSYDAAFKSKHESKRRRQQLVRGNKHVERKDCKETLELPTVQIIILK